MLPWCRKANIPVRSSHLPDVSPTLCCKSARDGPGTELPSSKVGEGTQWRREERDGCQESGEEG